ncbi:hypothetical protein C7212DRAFT_278864 [Tuber magnatum]|uniref:Acyl-CoA desaturase n=1 Tax=Tuber magnatum TaxID=42249 RepID=A0A317SR90_9PEZI|nr:hypothetical protein C7212DRAFT_278864 [Tuber magnatum]
MCTEESIKLAPSNRVTSPTVGAPQPKGDIWWSNALGFLAAHFFVLLSWWYPAVSGWKTYTLLLFNWQVGMYGITIGYHRLWSHRSFTASTPLRIFLAGIGTLGFQGSIRWWVVRHRLHHRYTDTESDPYSAANGLFFSHVGWIFYKTKYPKLPLVQKEDLDSDPVVAFQHRYFLELVFLTCVALPTAMGHFWLDGAWEGLLYGGIIPRVMTWHCTFLINSMAHYIGRQEYTIEVTARGNLLLAMLTQGEGNHNFHHAFPSDYRNGFKSTDWDPTKWIIALMHTFTSLVPSVHTTPDREVERAKSRAIGRDNGQAERDLPRVDLSEVSALYEGKPVIVIQGFLYDVGEFASRHPGGAALLERGYGGKDLSGLFEKLNRHTLQARDLMMEMKIGQIIS